MRSTSSRRSAVALLLCGTLLWRSAPTVAAETGPSRAPALLLKYAAPDLPDPSAREVLDPVPAIVAKELRIRWLPVPLEPSGKGTCRRRDPGSRRRGPAADRREGVPRRRADGKGGERRRLAASRGGRKGVPVVPLHGSDAPVPRRDLPPAGDSPSLGREDVRRRGAPFPRAGAAPGIHPGPRPVSAAGDGRVGSDPATPRPRSGTPGRVAPLRRGDLRRRRATGRHPRPRSNEGDRSGTDPRLPRRIPGCGNGGPMAAGGHGDIALFPSRRPGGPPRRASCRRRCRERAEARVPWSRNSPRPPGLRGWRS